MTKSPDGGSFFPFPLEGGGTPLWLGAATGGTPIFVIPPVQIVKEDLVLLDLVNQCEPAACEYVLVSVV